MPVVRWPPCACGAIAARCPFFWFFFLGKQKKRTKKLAEGIKQKNINNYPTLTKQKRFQYQWQPTHISYGVISIAEYTEIFAEYRKDESSTLSFSPFHQISLYLLLLQQSPMFKKILLLLSLYSLQACAQQPTYSVVKTYTIPSPGGWDYIRLHKGKLYVSHSTQVNILNATTGDSVGVIPQTTGVHGIAFDDALNHGYTSNGRLNNVTVFDLATNEVLAHVPTGDNPDAIFFEPFTKTIITCNGSSKSLSLIDPKANKVIQTIEVGGKPEEAVSDGTGHMYVNLEDRNEIAAIDLKTNKLTARWPLGAESPTGLAYDKATNRLFAGCDGKLVVLNAANGKVVTRLPIGDGCDGVAFNEAKKLIYTSNGQSGNLSVIQEKDADHYSVVGNYPTKRGARTLCFDEASQTIYLSTADFEPAVGSARPKMKPGTFQVLVVKEK
jgi:YVTN family beta-propeller protein